MLAAAYLKDFDGIARLGEAKHFSYDSQMVKEVIESASDKDREYFTEFGKLYADKKMLIDCYSEIESLHREYNRIESAIRLTDDTRYDYYIKVCLLFTVSIVRRWSFVFKRHRWSSSFYGCFLWSDNSYQFRN